MEPPYVTTNPNPLNLPVPSCLLRCDVITEDPAPVTLPARFMRVGKDWATDESQDCPESRGRDIASALRWVKQQMVRTKNSLAFAMKIIYYLHILHFSFRY